MASMPSMNGDSVPVFYVGHDDRKRDFAITDDVIERAEEYGVGLHF